MSRLLIQYRREKEYITPADKVSNTITKGWSKWRTIRSFGRLLIRYAEEFAGEAKTQIGIRGQVRIVLGSQVVRDYK